MFVQSYMTPDPVTLAEQDPVSKAQQLIRSRHVRQFPVVITAKVIGADPKPTFEAREDVGDRPPDVEF